MVGMVVIGHWCHSNVAMATICDREIGVRGGFSEKICSWAIQTGKLLIRN